MRIFIFSFRKCNGRTGGSGGVNYKIYLANTEYRIFDNLFNCFEDIIIEPNSRMNINDINMSCDQGNKLLKKMKRQIKTIGLIDIYMYQRKLDQACKWIKEINKIYQFNQNDIYIFQDIESAMGFFSLFSMKYTAIVYHQQGGLYAEWNAFNRVSSKLYHKYLTGVMRKAFSATENLAFPSLGAKASLLKTEPLLGDIMANKNINIVYNGFDKPQTIGPLSPGIRERLKTVAPDDRVFITVAQANYAKGVDRIPGFIRKIKEKGISCKWILVSNGEMAPQIASQILKNKIENNVIWIKHYISHDDILQLFSVSDFYILFHRWSVFDFATIEAMAYGNIPILTPVGGNLEAADKESGFFVDLESMDKVVESISVLSREEILGYKDRNRNREADLFSSESFIGLYKKLVDSILRK